jgi:hypothetical protein
MARLTHSRDGRHPGTDRLLLVGVAFGCTASVPLWIGLAYFLGLCEIPMSAWSLLSASAIAASLGAVSIRSSVLLFDKVLRPRVFDLEQRKHEIVPFHYSTRETHQDV